MLGRHHAPELRKNGPLAVNAEIRIADDADLYELARLRATWAYEYEHRPAPDELDSQFLSSFAGWWRREHEQRITRIAEIGHVPVGMLNMLVFTRMPRPERLMSQWGLHRQRVRTGRASKRWSRPAAAR